MQQSILSTLFGILAVVSLLSSSSARGAGETAATFGIDHLIAIGETAKLTVAAAQRAGLKRAVAVANTTEAAELLEQIVRPGDLVLVKGSRTARTEQVLETFSNLQLDAARS